MLYKKILEGSFHIPRFVGDDARDLLKRILVTDPTKRIKVREIRKHAWFLGKEEAGGKGEMRVEDDSSGEEEGKMLVPSA